MVGLNVKFKESGYSKVEYPETVSLHSVKSYAGRIFRDSEVQSVCVFDEDGVSWLYLKKTKDGVHREEKLA